MKAQRACYRGAEGDVYCLFFGARLKSSPYPTHLLGLQLSEWRWGQPVHSSIWNSVGVEAMS